jgi:hypothetical protein
LTGSRRKSRSKNPLEPETARNFSKKFQPLFAALWRENFKGDVCAI